MTIRRYTRDYHSVGVVIDDDSELDDISFCSTCAANGVMSKLKERIYLSESGKRLPDPPDAEDFKMCWQCGLIIPTREVKKSGTIQGIQGVEILQSPYDSKAVILGNDSKNRYQNLKRQKTKHPDSEVQRLIEDGFELVSYQSDSNILY